MDLEITDRTRCLPNQVPPSKELRPPSTRKSLASRPPSSNLSRNSPHSSRRALISSLCGTPVSPTSLPGTPVTPTYLPGTPLSPTSLLGTNLLNSTRARCRSSNRPSSQVPTRMPASPCPARATSTHGSRSPTRHLSTPPRSSSPRLPTRCLQGRRWSRYNLPSPGSNY